MEIRFLYASLSRSESKRKLGFPARKMNLTAQEIARATGGTWIVPATDLAVKSLSTDTRAIQKGQLFVALKGENFDAHDYLDAAQKKGASALLVHDTSLLNGHKTTIPIVKVRDTLKALGDLAIAWRKRCTAHRTAIVGSSGKTTAKEMLAAILGAAAPTLANPGNYNNLIGLPLTLFRLARAHRYAVLELGMNEPGELARLAEIARPDLLIFLNVGNAHIGKFGSLEALLDAKSEAIQRLDEEATILYNLACPNTRRIVERWTGRRPLATFAVEQPTGTAAAAGAAYRATHVRSRAGLGYSFDLETDAERTEIELPLFGRYNIENALAAAAAAHTLGIPLGTIARTLGEFRPTGMRSEIRRVAGVTLIVDCYNANPESMTASLASLADEPAGSGRTFLVLGEMGELGDRTDYFHDQVARQVAGMKVDGVFLMGDAMQAVVDRWEGPARAVRLFDKHDDLADRLIPALRPDDRVFFKGSRANELERVVRRLENDLARQKE